MLYALKGRFHMSDRALYGTCTVSPNWESWTLALKQVIVCYHITLLNFELGTLREVLFLVF